MSWRRLLAIASIAGPVVGFLACSVEWKPDERTTFTGFPLPIGVIVRRDDGTYDCGSGGLAFVLNPIAWFLAILLAGSVVLAIRRWRAGPAA